MKSVRRVLICVLLLAAAGAHAADEVRDALRRGNEHYAAGRYAEALECYAQAADGAAAQRRTQKSGAAAPAEVLHDQAAALFKLGRIDEARALWLQAKGLKDAAFEARAEYNLGNCAYADALAAAQRQEMKPALEHLGKAAERYRDALRLDATLADARANLELAQLLRQQIEELQQNPPQSQPSSSSQPQSQPQSQPSDQQQQGENSTQPQSQPASQPESQPSQQEHSQEQEQSQENQPSEEQANEQPESQPNQSDENQENAASQPANAESQPAESQPGEEQPGEQPPGVQMTREQAERLLQKVRDAEKARREMLARQRMSRQKPPERDW